MTELLSEAESMVRSGARDSGRGLPWKARTACGKGHEYTEANTLYRTDGYGGARRCRACKHARYQDYYQRRGRELRRAQRAEKRGVEK